MGDPERLLSAIEDERNDEIFLVVEMSKQSCKKHSARIRIVIAAPAQCVGGRPQRLQEGVGCFGRSRHVGVNVVMIAFQDIKPSRQPRIGSLKDRKIVEIFDLVVNVELVQHELQSRHERTGELGGRKTSRPEAHRDIFDCGRELAKHRMPRQPEASHPAEVCMSIPLFARVAGEQHPQILRPPAAEG